MDNTIYKKRRDNLEEILPNNSVLLLPGADLQYRNADSAHAFRQESSFFYFSGFCEPSSLIVIINNDMGLSSIIFVPPKDKLKEIWDGHRAGPIGAVDNFMFDKAYDNSQIDSMMPDILQGSEQVLYSIGKKQGFDQKVIERKMFNRTRTLDFENYSVVRDIFGSSWVYVGWSDVVW